MIKKHIIRFFILSLYVGLSLFLSLLIMFMLLLWLQLDLNTSWLEWKSHIFKILLLSFKLSLMGIPIGFVLWFFYYRKM